MIGSSGRSAALFITSCQEHVRFKEAVQSLVLSRISYELVKLGIPADPFLNQHSSTSQRRQLGSQVLTVLGLLKRLTTMPNYSKILSCDINDPGGIWVKLSGIKQIDRSLTADRPVFLRRVASNRLPATSLKEAR